MPSKHLQETIDSLSARGAKRLPTIDDIEGAPDGTEWAGVNNDNLTKWRLVKVQGDKYDLPASP